MLDFDINSPHASEQHECNVIRDRDWIIYRCPKCNYELRDNWRTGELIIRNAKANINHSGSYFPLEYKDAFEYQN